MKDRRGAQRYDLSLPIYFSEVVAGEGGSTNGSGKTRDISNRGVYFTIANDFVAGAELDLKMTLPTEITTGNLEVLIKATGKVIRVDKRTGNGDEKVGVAAAFDRYEIVRGEVAIK